MRSVESLDSEVSALWKELGNVSRRVRRLESLEDTMNTPLRRKIVFLIDGWPLFRVVDRPQWRPWRRWWTS